MEEEARKRRETIRNLIRACRKIENSNKTSRVEFKKEIQHYQEYMTDFKDYIDFKSANPYAEKDFDFERSETPWLSVKRSAEYSPQTRYMDASDQRSISIIRKYGREEAVKTPEFLKGAIQN